MAENKQMITANSEEEFVQKLEQVWGDISRQVAQQTAETVIRTERWENGVKRLNQALLTVAATLVLMFPFECAIIAQLHVLANAYASSI